MNNNISNYNTPHLITAGSTYLDIDAYACMVAMAELMQQRGQNAVAYSCAPANYSVTDSLIRDDQITREVPHEISDSASYIIVDVSDPDFLRGSVPLERVVEIYDHHVGFEDYWTSHIGERSHIEFIGAAATLIYREWKRYGLHDRMRSSTARLLVAAILDNTLNLTSSNTTPEDIKAFSELSKLANISKDWCAEYFSEVQRSVESDLKNALFGDIKRVRNNPVLPERVAQLAVWNSSSILGKLDEIRTWFLDTPESWMINLIDIREQCSYFICDDAHHQQKVVEVFDVHFKCGVARSSKSYLRKEIIKKTI